jgi:hypothetical protein
MVKTKTAKSKHSLDARKSTTTLLSLEKDNITGIYDPNGLYNNPLTNAPYKNLYGNVIKLIMITASGAEGINLKNTRYVHIIEPYWHMVRLEQVIGRAVRTKSHCSLPLKDRNVEIYLHGSYLNAEEEMVDMYNA